MSRHVARFLIVLGITLASLTLDAPITAATQPGHNGRIAFMRWNGSGFPDLWTANPDLSHQVQVTSGYGAGFPAWSPDGTRIAFSSGRCDPDPEDGVEIQDIFTIRADGSDLRKITPSVGDTEKPTWSPDGRWLAFSTDAGNYPAGQGIYVIPSDGSAPMRMVTPKPEGTFWSELARFSPDGRKLLFTAYRGANEVRNVRQEKLAGFEFALFVVGIDGSGLRQLTPWGLYAGDGDWSPDGSRIVFQSSPPHLGHIQHVMIVDADGQHLRSLTQDHGLTGLSSSDQSPWYEESFNPVWSPDGTRIMFVHASYTPEVGFNAGLQTMNPDGSDRRWVSDGHGEEHQPDWGTAPLAR